MPSPSDVLPIWCPECDARNTPSKIIRLLHTRTPSGAMMVKCIRCGQTMPYETLMARHPRMDRPVLTEKQPANTLQIAVWIYPEALEALRRRFPDNLQTTLCATMTALADHDTVLVEGEHARAMRELGVNTGRDVLGLARQVKALTGQLEEARVREKALEPFLKLIAGAAAGTAGQHVPGSSSSPSSPLPTSVDYVEGMEESEDGFLTPEGEWVAAGTGRVGAVQPTQQGQPTQEEPAYRGIPKPVPGGR